MTLLYTILAVLMFGILITIHEVGHFLAARISRIPVKEFAIGFGPQILKWKSKKHETVFFLRAIPMGGYCMFYGEDDIEGKEVDDPRSFGRFHFIKRLFTVLMGPVMNIALAFFVAFLFYLISGVPTITGDYTTKVQAVNQGSPADAAGMVFGDEFISINGIRVTNNLSELVEEESKANKLPLDVVVNRIFGEHLVETNLSVTPLYDQEAKRYMMGISVSASAAVDWKKGNVVEVGKSAYELCVRASGSILESLRDLVTKGKGINELSGVVGVTQTIVKQTQDAQLQGYLSMMILISINLGLINLLPIPGLDGSRLLFILVEAVRGKPIKKEAYIHAAGMILLFALMLFITLRDIMRLF